MRVLRKLGSKLEGRLVTAVFAAALGALTGQSCFAEPAPVQPPLADTVSPEALKTLTPIYKANMVNTMPVEKQRELASAIQRGSGAAQLVKLSVEMTESTLGGVPVRIFRPKGRPPVAGKILMNLHGGGFVLDSGSMTETIPLVARTGIEVVAVLYRLAPEHPFPAAVDDAEKVYDVLASQYGAQNIGVFGTSAGAVLTPELMVRLKSKHHPLPAAIGIFSGSADLARAGDSEGFLPALNGERSPELIAPYIGATDPKNAELSPLYGDLSGFPPALLISSTRDVFLSQTVILHLALRRAGNQADLIVFEGLPHAFWSWLELPEGSEAFDEMADFFDRALGIAQKPVLAAVHRP